VFRKRTFDFDDTRGASFLSSSSSPSFFFVTFPSPLLAGIAFRVKTVTSLSNDVVAYCVITSR